MIIEGMTKAKFSERAEDLILDALIPGDLEKRFARYTDIMDTARSFGAEFVEDVKKMAKYYTDQYKEQEMWELPESFDKPVQLAPFPVSSLPQVMHDYLKAVADYVQIVPEMAALPLLSVLSLCVMGKAVIQHPGNNHTEHLNLYTMTIAAPGERKSGSFKEFMKPVEQYQEYYNQLHQKEIEEYLTTKAFLEKKKLAAMSGKNASLDEAKKYARELAKLEPVHPLKLNINDVTPEGLAWEMYLQGGKMGVVDDEGSIFDVLSGLYSGGTVNINLFLKAYDGSSYTIVRRTKEDIELQSPLLTVGLMVQPDHFDEAMNNRQFSGRGFIYRFLFCFPESKAGFRNMASENIPEAVQKAYNALVTNLLKMETPEKPYVLTFNRKAVCLLENYFDYIEQRMRPGGQFENMKEWANKQFGKCLKIAGILHLCSHKPTEQVDEQTALYAVSIATWAENHALKALSGEMTDTQETKDAKYVLSKLKQANKGVLSKRDLLRKCSTLTADCLEIPLEMLEDMHCIKREIIKTGDKGRPREQIRINPLLLKSI